MSYVDDLIEKLDGNDMSSNVPAAVYARVSTRNEGQKDSCSNQVKSAREFIESHKNISISEDRIYIDDGYSGKSVVNRDGYKKLIDSITSGKTKLVIAKTSSRLFRSVPEAMLFMQTLIKYDAVLYTMENSKFWDFSKDELLFTFESVMNANTSKIQHDAGITAQERRVKDKQLLPKDVVTGFKWDKKKKDIIIDADYKDYIIEIFKDYVYRNVTPREKANDFRKREIRFPKHRRDKDTKKSSITYEYLCTRTIENILSNKKYTGIFTINTRGSKYIPGEPSQRFKIENEKDQTIIDRRADLQIIDPKLFDIAQRIRESKVKTYVKREDKEFLRKNFEGKHPFVHKIYCSCCGQSFRHDMAGRKNKVPVYRIPIHTDCESPINRIFVDDLENLVRKALKMSLDRQPETLTNLETILERTVKASRSSLGDLDKKKKEKAKFEDKIDVLIEELSNRELSPTTKERIEKKIKSYEEKIAELTSSIEEMDALRLDDSYVIKKMAEVKKVMDELRHFTTFDKASVENFISRIDVYPTGDISVQLKTGEDIKVKLPDIYIMDNKDNGNDSISNVGAERKQDAPCS